MIDERPARGPPKVLKLWTHWRVFCQPSLWAVGGYAGSARLAGWAGVFGGAQPGNRYREYPSILIPYPSFFLTAGRHSIPYLEVCLGRRGPLSPSYAAVRQSGYQIMLSDLVSAPWQTGADTASRHAVVMPSTVIGRYSRHSLGLLQEAHWFQTKY